MILKKWFLDLPGGPVVKNPPANAGDMGSIPGSGRFHMPQSNQAHVLQLLKLMLCHTESHHNEKPEHQN